MPKTKTQTAIRNMNFRQTHSERSATSSYRNFRKGIKKLFLTFKFKGTSIKN